MKNNSLRLSILGVFAILLLVSFASAQIELTASHTSFAQPDGSTLTINVANITSGNNVTFSFSSVKDGSNKEIAFTTSPSYLTADGVITITTQVPQGFNFLDLGSFTLTATEKDSTDSIVGVARTLTLNFEKTSFCYFNNNPDRVNNNKDLAVEIEDIQVIKGFGEDDEWFLFDEIEVEVNVENRNNEDFDNIVLEWGLYDPKTGEWVIELNEQDDFDLKDGDEKTLTFSFTLDNDLDMDLSSLKSGKLLLYVRASGDNDDGNFTCNTADTEKVSLVIDKDFVKVHNIKMLDYVSCGSEIPITAEVWNIGSSSQDDVSVTIFNRELGINQRIEVGDINKFKKQKISTSITIPKDASEKSYSLLFSVYDEDGDLFETSNDDVSEVVYTFQVNGSCSNIAPVEVSAELVSGSKAGEELTIKAKIKNLDTIKRTFNLQLEGYSEWASSASLDKSTLEIPAGASQEVLITLIPNENTEGQKTFNLIVNQDKKTVSQSIGVTVESSKKSGANIFSNVNDFLKTTFGKNWYLWAIGILNAILVIIIVVVVLKLVNKK